MMKRASATPDAGVAMILVIVWSASLMVLTLIVSQSIINAIRPSELNETSFQALAAAEAGVDRIGGRHRPPSPRA